MYIYSMGSRWIGWPGGQSTSQHPFRYKEKKVDYRISGDISRKFWEEEAGIEAAISSYVNKFSTYYVPLPNTYNLRQITQKSPNVD